MRQAVLKSRETSVSEMTVSKNWLAQLRQLHDDRARREAEAAQQQQQAQRELAQQDAITVLLRESRAHELLRQVQKALLDGGGTLTLYDKARTFDKAIVLAWQGPISDARRPAPNSAEPVYYILVGVRQGQLWVNRQPVKTPTPAALKAALLEAAKNPDSQPATPKS
ncbi:MAG: hypothetical protein Kow0031_40530 [Anaerolineae bacterium]